MVTFTEEILNGKLRFRAVYLNYIFNYYSLISMFCEKRSNKCKKSHFKNIHFLFLLLSRQNFLRFLIFFKVSAKILKKRLWHRCFPVNFAKFLRTLFLRNTSRRLLLDMGIQLYNKKYHQKLNYFKRNHRSQGIFFSFLVSFKMINPLVPDVYY